MSRTVLLLISLFLLSVETHAEGTAFIGYGSGVNDGLEVNVGFTKYAHGFTLSFSPLAGVIYSGESDPRYRKETFSNGQTVCRDLSNGQFSKKENCASGVNVEYTPTVEATYDVASAITVGAGFRGGDSSGAYGVLMYRRSSRTYFGIRAGSEYRGVSFGGWF